MECQKCPCTVTRSVATNSRDRTQTIRKRECPACGHTWFTVELPVSEAHVTWRRLDRKGQSKPVLRVPVEIAVGSEAV